MIWQKHISKVLIRRIYFSSKNNFFSKYTRILLITYMTPTKAISCPGGHYVNFLVPKLLSQSSSPVFILTNNPFWAFFFSNQISSKIPHTPHLYLMKRQITRQQPIQFNLIPTQLDEVHVRTSSRPIEVSSIRSVQF